MARVGLYEADEAPRRCPKCQDTDSRTVRVWITGAVRHRHRVCRKCGRLFASTSPMPRDEYLSQPNPAIMS